MSATRNADLRAERLQLGRLWPKAVFFLNYLLADPTQRGRAAAVQFTLRICSFPIAPVGLVAEKTRPSTKPRVILNHIEDPIGQAVDALADGIPTDLSVSLDPSTCQLGFM